MLPAFIPSSSPFVSVGAHSPIFYSFFTAWSVFLILSSRAHLTLFQTQGTNILLTAQLITGGSSTINALTGMHTYAACCLIPATVIAYTLVGGLRATFFSDYAHTTLIFVIILVFMVCSSTSRFSRHNVVSDFYLCDCPQFSTFATNPNLGSPSKVYDLLQEAASNYPLEGNAQGSYTTFRSTNGLVFGIIVIISGITTVFMDQTYWQRAVASKSSTSMKGYLWGG